MDPEAAGNAGRQCCTGRLDGGKGHGGAVGDDRRQQRRRAVAGVGGADGADAFDIRRVIEEDAAAAIHLDVDEAGRQQSAGEIDALDFGAKARHRQHGFDAVAGNQHGVIGEPGFAVENLGPDERETLVHTVSVTFERPRGTSGSKPRARATASTKP